LEFPNPLICLSIFYIIRAYFLLRSIKGVIKIEEIIRKNFYFVSNIKTGILTIIDGLCNTVLKEIIVGERPFKLAIKDYNTICVACEMSNTISFVNCTSGEILENPIPNNGNIQIDTMNNRIYVSNTSEVNIYDMNFAKLVGHIKGLSAIIDLRLNKEGSKLYVLDTLLMELRIYRTDNYNLIETFTNLGINPTFILISEDDKKVYISMLDSILNIDIISKKFTKLILPKGSLIAGMVLKENTIYASNLGLNRIDLIDIPNYECYSFILTSKPEPTNLFITEDKTKLLVTNRNSESYGGIDIIDLKSNSLIGSILMNTLNSQPYDVISLILPYTYVPTIAINDLHQGNQEITIIAKKIFSTYNEKLNFPFIRINLSKYKDFTFIFQKIKFESGIIVQNSELRSRLSTTSRLSNIKFIVRVNYIINYLENCNHNIVNGFFEKPIDVFFNIPENRDLEEFQLDIITTTKFTTVPKMLDNVISFGVTTLMELKILGEDEIHLTNLKEAFGTTEEGFEEFTNFNDPIFTSDINFPFK